MTSNSNSNAANRLSSYNARSERVRKEQHDYAATIVPAMADRCCHIPGNNYCQDWYQYVVTNHPVFGICFHHELHPVGCKQRFVTLIGSVAFGLIITNIYFISLISTDEAFDGLHAPILSITANSTLTEGDADPDSSGQQITITYGMILLWTVGTSIHSLFDLSIWYISACACCHPGGRFESCGCCKKLGSTFVVFAVVIVVAVASIIVVLRASIESQTKSIDTRGGEDTDDSIKFGQVDGVESFDFLLSWSVELAIALFVTYPLFATVIFSGVLGCGRLYFLGGRPREMWLEEREQERFSLQRSSTDETDSV